MARRQISSIKRFDELVHVPHAALQFGFRKQRTGPAVTNAGARAHVHTERVSVALRCHARDEGWAVMESTGSKRARPGPGHEQVYTRKMPGQQDGVTRGAAAPAAARARRREPARTPSQALGVGFCDAIGRRVAVLSDRKVDEHLRVGALCSSWFFRTAPTRTRRSAQDVAAMADTHSVRCCRWFRQVSCTRWHDDGTRARLRRAIAARLCVVGKTVALQPWLQHACTQCTEGSS